MVFNFAISPFVSVISWLVILFSIFGICSLQFAVGYYSKGMKVYACPHTVPTKSSFTLAFE